MSHVGTFAVIRDGVLRLTSDRWAGSFATAWFARGPENADAMAIDFTDVTSLEMGEAGFLIDFDEKTGLLYDVAVQWGPKRSGTEVRLAALRELDLVAKERAVLEKAFAAGKRSAKAFFAALQKKPFASKDHYGCWTLQFVKSTDELRTYAAERGLAGAWKSDAVANRDALDFLSALQAMGPAGTVEWSKANAARAAEGLPPLSPREWLAGRRS